MMGFSQQSAPAPAPATAAPPVMPRFQFAPRTGRVDWRRVASVNIDRMARDMDVEVLQKLLRNVAFCDIEGEDLSDVDPNVVKLFRLSQYMLEYTLHAQDFLAGQAASSADALRETRGALEKLQKEHARLKDEDSKRRKAIAT